MPQPHRRQLGRDELSIESNLARIAAPTISLMTFDGASNSDLGRMVTMRGRGISEVLAGDPPGSLEGATLRCCASRS
jgi:hypothetical protein